MEREERERHDVENRRCAQYETTSLRVRCPTRTVS
jgi:hypothetical protein